MKPASLVFFFLLLVAHGMVYSGRLLAQPLSLFRDGDRSWLGYALFDLLLLIGLLYTVALLRSGREGEAGISLLAVLLLVVVVLTPSRESFHLLCSFLVFLLLFVYYALLL